MTSTPERVAWWDLDKTYLRTDFDSPRELIRTALERPDQKRTVPGAAAVMRALGRRSVRIHILSGSPEQLRTPLQAKLRIDGVQYASLTLKPNLKNLLALRFRALRDQLGYKLPALLRGLATRVASGTTSSREVLLGDDAEADAFVYSLYAAISMGEVDAAMLHAIMTKNGCYQDTIDDALSSLQQLPKERVVDRVLIHLDRQSPPSDFGVYGRFAVPFYNYMQAAFVLADMDWLQPDDVWRVARELHTVHKFGVETLGRSYRDLLNRGQVSSSLAAKLTPASADADFAPLPIDELSARLTEEARAVPVPPPTSLRPSAPFSELVAKHNPRKSALKH